MIITKSRKSNKYIAYIVMAMGFVIIIGLFPSMEFEATNQIITGTALLLVFSLLFFALPIAILKTNKELIIDKNVLIIKSNTSGEKVFELSQMLKWRFDKSYQRFQIHHGIIQILKPDRKLITIQESEYDKFDDILKYLNSRYRNKQVKKWTDNV